jgi:hypothetical protein
MDLNAANEIELKERRTELTGLANENWQIKVDWMKSWKKQQPSWRRNVKNIKARRRWNKAKLKGNYLQR